MVGGPQHGWYAAIGPKGVRWDDHRLLNETRAVRAHRRLSHPELVACATPPSEEGARAREGEGVRRPRRQRDDPVIGEASDELREEDGAIRVPKAELAMRIAAKSVDLRLRAIGPGAESEREVAARRQMAQSDAIEARNRLRSPSVHRVAEAEGATTAMPAR